MGLAYGGCGGVGVGALLVVQRSNASNAPLYISEGICVIATLVKTVKEGKLTDISPLASVSVPTAPEETDNKPLSILKGASDAKISLSISDFGSAAKISETEKAITTTLASRSAAKISHFIFQGGSAAKILETENTDNPRPLLRAQALPKFWSQLRKRGR